MGGPNEPPNGPAGSDGQQPQWETTEFPAFPGYDNPGNDGSQGFGEPSYGYGTPPSHPSPSGSGAEPPQAYPGQPNYPGQPGYTDQQGYPGQQGYADQQGYPGQQGYAGDQGYPGQGVPPGQWPPQSPGWQGQPPPPGKGRKTALIASVAVLVAAGAGVGIYFAVSGSGGGTKQADKTGSISAPPSPGPTTSAPTESAPPTTQESFPPTSPVSSPPTTKGKVVVPQSFDGYSLLDNPAAKAAKSAISGEATGPGATLLANATVEVYGETGSELPQLITISLPTSTIPGAETSSLFVTSFLTGAGVNPKEAGTNTHGGSAMCGVPAGSGGTPEESACAWSDSTNSGAIVSTLPALSPSKLAAVQDAFRGRLG